MRVWKKKRRTQICEFARYSDVVSRENITTAAAREFVTAVLQMAPDIFPTTERGVVGATHLRELIMA